EIQMPFFADRLRKVLTARGLALKPGELDVWNLRGNQTGKESIDRIGGSGVFARDPDSILIMTKHKVENAFTVEATLRNFGPIPPFCVQWEHPLMKAAPDLNPDDLKQSGARSKSQPTDEEFESRSALF